MKLVPLYHSTFMKLKVQIKNNDKYEFHILLSTSVLVISVEEWYYRTGRTGFVVFHISR